MSNQKDTPNRNRLVGGNEVNTREDVFDDYDDGVFIEYLEVGDRPEMLGGPATEPGWYLHPVCMMGCCVSDGPFPSRKAAKEADRDRSSKITGRTRGNNDESNLLSVAEINEIARKVFG
jgi:hypothetical protein